MNENEIKQTVAGQNYDMELKLQVIEVLAVTKKNAMQEQNLCVTFLDMRDQMMFDPCHSISFQIGMILSIPNYLLYYYPIHSNISFS